MNFTAGRNKRPGLVSVLSGSATLRLGILCDAPPVAEPFRWGVVGVIGNHGEMGGPARKEYHPESNADAIAYNIARQHLLNAANVEWVETIATDERAWQAVDEVRGKRWMLWHGNQVKSASYGIPWYGFRTRLLGWHSEDPFDYAVSGHWHTAVRMQVNRITAWGAGSTESANTYAKEWLASGGQAPSQWLLFQGHRGMAAEHLIRLDEAVA